MIRLQCPGCQKNLGVRDDLAGRLVACPQCKARIRVPPPAIDELEEVDDAVVESISTAPRPGRQPPFPKTRPRDEEEEEQLEEVRRPRRRQDDAEAADEEEPRPRPSRKRMKKRRGRRAESGGGVSGLFIAIGVVAAICLVALVASIFVPLVALVPLLLGWLLAFAGGVWFLVCAFQDDVMQGLLCLFIPFYSLIYLITHFEEVKKPFLVQVVGTVLVVGSICAGSIRAPKEAGGPYRPRGQVLVPSSWGEPPV